MRAYQYKFLGSDGGLEARLTLHADSDDRANDVGSRILAGSAPECVTLEISKDDTLVFQIARPGSFDAR